MELPRASVPGGRYEEYFLPDKQHKKGFRSVNYPIGRSKKFTFYCLYLILNDFTIWLHAMMSSCLVPHCVWSMRGLVEIRLFGSKMYSLIDVVIIEMW